MRSSSSSSESELSGATSDYDIEEGKPQAGHSDDALGFEMSYQDMLEKRNRIPSEDRTMGEFALAQLKRFVPIVEWLPKYKLHNLKGDLAAGLTVGVMLVPQGMAYALVAGLPPIYGLYASVIPLLVYALLGTSRELAIGPVAIVSLMVAEVITEFIVPVSDSSRWKENYPLLADTKFENLDNDVKDEVTSAYTAEYVSYTITIAFLTGLMQMGLGLVRGGVLVNFLSHPVLSGFTSGAALIIGMSQMKHVFGTDPKKSDNFFVDIYELLASLGKTNGWTLFMCLVALALLIFMKEAKARKWRWYQKAYLHYLPSQLVVVVIGILVSWAADIKETANIKVVGEVPSGLMPLSAPNFETSHVGTLALTAALIAIVGFMESVAVAKKIAEAKGNEVDPNQELIALGASNFIGSFFSSFPVTGGFSRTAVNNQAGATSPVASLFSVIIVFVSLMVLGPALAFIPNNILAAIILVAVIGLVDTDEAKHLWHISKIELVMWFVSFFATLAIGIELGIAVAVGFSILLVLHGISSPHKAILGRLPHTTAYRNVKRYPKALVVPGILAVRFDAPMFFGNAESFKTQLLREVKTAEHGADPSYVGEYGDPIDPDEEVGLPTKLPMDSSESEGELASTSTRHADSEIERCSPIRFLIIDLSATGAMDSTAALVLSSIIDTLGRRNVRIAFCGANGPVRDMLKRAGLIDKIGRHRMFWDIRDAVSTCADSLQNKLTDVPYKHVSRYIKMFEHEETGLERPRRAGFLGKIMHSFQN